VIKNTINQGNANNRFDTFMSKHILFTVTNDLTYDQRMKRICGSLANNGYRVTLVGRELKQSKPLQKLAFSQHRLKCICNKGALFYIEFNIRLFFYLLGKSVDVYGCVDLDTIMPVCTVSWMKRKPWTFDSHEYFTEVPELIGRNVVKKIWEFIASRSIHFADRAYTVSFSLAAMLEKQYERKFYVVRNVPMQKIESVMEADKHKEFQLIYQGDLNIGRGLEKYIMAMKSIQGHLLIVGDGPIINQLRKLVKVEQVESKVTFYGYVDADTLRLLTSQSHLGLNLLDNQSLSYYHSLSNKYFNYIHAHIPQLCANFPEYKMLNEELEVAMLIDYEVEAIVAAVNQLINDESLYIKLKRNCMLACDRFNWQNEEKQLIAIYDQIT
jgi:glycosyltransferase involved in cell wall biosynthesis